MLSVSWVHVLHKELILYKLKIRLFFDRHLYLLTKIWFPQKNYFNFTIKFFTEITILNQYFVLQTVGWKYFTNVWFSRKLPDCPKLRLFSNLPRLLDYTLLVRDCRLRPVWLTGYLLIWSTWPKILLITEMGHT